MDRHHVLGLLVIIIGVLFNSANEIIYNNPKQLFKYLGTVFTYFGISLGNQLAYSLEKILEKYLIDKSYIDPLLLLSLEGFTGMAICSISLIVVGQYECRIIKGNDELFSSFCMKEKQSDIVYIENAIWCFKFIFSHY